MNGMLGAAGTAADQPAPQVVGSWTGTWGPMGDPKAVDAGKAAKGGARLDCKVDPPEDGKWSATFEGECGRPYKYTIKMLGRQSGGVVLFQGTADLGPKDGGVYDWIGRASDTEFVGFFTSRGHLGTFRMERPK